MIKVGLFYLFETLGQMDPSEFYQQALEETVYGEELGFWATCPAEHHFSANYGIMPRVELFLALCAGRTERMKLWPMLSIAPLGHPLRIAEDFALLDQFSKGRAICSIGTGYRRYEFKRFGQDMDENHARLNETIQMVDRLFTESEVTFEGEHYSCHNATLQPRPYQQPRPPIYITTTRNEQIRWAAERGVGVVPAAGFNAATLKHDYDVHREAAKAAGQPEMEVRPFFKWIYVHEDHETAVREGTNYILRTLMAFAQGGGKLFSLLMGKSMETWGDDLHKPEWFSAEVDKVMAAGISYDDMIASGWSPYVCGSPDHVVEVLRPFVEAGGNFFIGGFKCGPMPPEKVRNSMRLFAEEVLPRL